jgi:iron complex transport system substrate-binding protein
LRWGVAVGALALLGGAAFSACGDDNNPAATATASAGASAPSTTVASATASPAANPFAGVDGIVDPTNHRWPRQVKGLNGTVTIKQKPARITTMSAGFDEITLGLVPVSRMVGVGSATKNPDVSSMSAEVQDVPTVGRDPESVASVDPDLVVASPTQKADVVAAIAKLAIPIVQLKLDPTPEGRIATILLLGYMYGEEERAVTLANEVQKRYEAVTAITSKIPDADRPMVLSATEYTSMFIAGSGTTGEGIVTAAGGINAGTRSGIVGNATASLENVVATDPDIIIIPMAAAPGAAYKAELMSAAALANTPAIKNGKVFVVPPQLYTTNSFENVRAVEHLAHILWPADFPVADPPPFTLPTGQ